MRVTISCPKCHTSLNAPTGTTNLFVKCKRCEHSWEWIAASFEVIRCPACTQRLRVPTDKGHLSVRCPDCRHECEWPPSKSQEKQTSIGPMLALPDFIGGKQFT